MRPRPRKSFALRPSLLDRLTDDYPSKMSPRGASSSYTWAEHLHAFRRDLANLLNTRQRFEDDELVDTPQLKNSILTYGFPRTSSLEWMGVGEQKRLAKELIVLLRRFEPRLLSPQVTPVGIEGLGKLHFRIEGALQSDPAPVRVAFDTYLDLERTEYSVEGA